MVISYEFLTGDDQAAAKTLRGDPWRERVVHQWSQSGLAKAHATTSQSCCSEQMLPPAVTCKKKKKGNKIQPWFVWPESLRISFEANYFRVAEAAENSGTGGSCGLWQLEISETLLWGERGVELGSGGDLKPKPGHKDGGDGEGSSSRREFLK